MEMSHWGWEGLSDRDWLDDSEFPNGWYPCVCPDCGNEFIGNKHRILCRICDNQTIEIFEQEYLRLLQVEIDHQKLKKLVENAKI